MVVPYERGAANLRYLLPRKISVIFDGNSDNVVNTIFSDHFSSVYKMTYAKKIDFNEIRLLVFLGDHYWFCLFKEFK